MPHILIVGLPKAMRRRAEATLEQWDFFPSTIPADVGRDGKLKIVPSQEDAIQKLYNYCELVADTYSDAVILVLPYAPIDANLQAELDTLEDLGAKVTFTGEPGSNWPAIKPGKKLDTAFFNAVFECLLDDVLGERELEELAPSDYIRALAQEHPKFIIVANALERCDEAAPHRHDFLRNSADAFIDLIQQKSGSGRTDAFFREKGIHHAQTGGITVKTTIVINGVAYAEKKVNTHLTSGNHTTAQAATRIYYHELHHEDETYIFVLYVGPHPETDLTRRYEFTC